MIQQQEETSIAIRSILDLKVSRFIFFFVSLIVAGLLAFRSIPGIFDHNDTGRYIYTFHEICSSPMSFDWHKRLTIETYNLLTRPLCLVEDNWLYMFLMALPVPMGFFLFGTWRGSSSLLLACSLIGGFAGFEFMTNALRQSASLFFLLAAFSFRGRVRWQIGFAICALLLHESNSIFIPLLFAIEYLNADTKRIGKGVLYIILIIAVIGVSLYGLNVLYFGGSGSLADLFDLYERKYEYDQPVWFQLFVMFPVVWVFLMRWKFSKFELSLEENISFAYSVIVFVVTIIYFPYITYRFAMTAIALQLYLAMRNNKYVSSAAVWILGGIMLHMMVYAFLSNNVSAVLFG